MSDDTPVTHMQQIWKFPLPIGQWESQQMMPEGATILHVDQQNSMVCLWALVSPVAPREVRTFHIIPTGVPIENVGKYLGSVIIEPYVWHVFEDTHDTPA